uniref:Uncharacterized protein n=1 Tax=Buteo japonicus TaxID=224669 RepID=A0A8C0C267_9AVES
LTATDGLPLAGNHVRVSFCAPGPPGRSMLAALIAAQATVRLVCALNRGKGLLPEPNILQILNSLGNPASLQLLLGQGGVCPPCGILGAAPSVPLVTNPALSTALLQLALQNQTQAQQVRRNFADAAFPLKGEPPSLLGSSSIYWLSKRFLRRAGWVGSFVPA